MGNFAYGAYGAPAGKLVQLVRQFVCLVGLYCLGPPLGLPTASAADDDFRSRSVGERVHRYRPASIAIQKVSEILKSKTGKQVAETEILRVAQVVLDLETDSFSDELISVRLAAEGCLGSAAENVHRKYDSLTNLEASRSLADAIANPSAAKFRQVCRRFYLTPSGYVAAERLVASWLDAGEYGLASRLASQVLSEPVHHSRITPQFRRVAAASN